MNDDPNRVLLIASSVMFLERPSRRGNARTFAQSFSYIHVDRWTPRIIRGSVQQEQVRTGKPNRFGETIWLACTDLTKTFGTSAQPAVYSSAATLSSFL